MDFELTEQQAMLKSMARKFAEQEMLPTLREYEKSRKVNFQVIKKMAELGLIGAHIPQEYGGSGLGPCFGSNYLGTIGVGKLDSIACLTGTCGPGGHYHHENRK